VNNTYACAQGCSTFDRPDVIDGHRTTIIGCWQ
jgi:hypothetical protein